jgi:hypothetical protein
MRVTLVDMEQAVERLDGGEQAYEFQTEDNSLRMLGPACGFGPDYLRRLRGEGLYAESLEEARAHALTKNVSVTGVWFVKQQ